jgi:hypothetical protein
LVLENTVFKSVTGPAFWSTGEVADERQLWFFNVAFEDILVYTGNTVRSGFRHNYCDLMTIKNVKASGGFIRFPVITDMVTQMLSHFSCEGFTSLPSGFVDLLEVGTDAFFVFEAATFTNCVMVYSCQSCPYFENCYFNVDPATNQIDGGTCALSAEPKISLVDCVFEGLG